MSSLQENLTTLEDILVREFRACQTLHIITKDEQKLLSNGDIHKLLTLVERKESVLDNLSQLEEKLRIIVLDLATIVNLHPQSASLGEVLSVINNDFSERLERLREGILALLGVIRNLTYGNQAIATAGLERLDGVQAFLLDLYQSVSDYNQIEETQTQPLPLALDLDHRA